MIQLALGDDVRWPLRPGQWLAVALYAMAFPLFTVGLAMAPSLRDPWLVLLPASAAILGPAWHQASIDRPKGLPRALARAAVRVGFQAAAVVAATALAMQLNPQLASDDFVWPAALFSLALAALFAGGALWDGLPRRRVSIYATLGGLGVAGCFAAMAIWGLWAVLGYWVATAIAIVALLVLKRRRTR
jgi:hypothetical protein